MQKILIVDDEALFTKSLAEGLSAMEPNWQVFTAKNGKEASDFLEENLVHLVATDLKMPVMDGFQLLARLATHHGDIPVIVMSAFATPEMEERLEMLGIDQFLEKPLDLATFHAKIRSTLEASAKGFVRGITLPTFLQMIEMERKTCTITVTSGEKSGRLYFRKGILLDAEIEDLRGVMAAMDLLSWDEAALEIRNGCKVGKRAIPFDLQHLLMECMRNKDEEARQEVQQNESGAIEDQGDSRHFDEAHGSGTGDFAFGGMEQLTELEGLLGLAVIGGDRKVLMTWPEGSEESLAPAAESGYRIAIAIAQACEQMEVGESLLAHVEAEEGHIFVMELSALRCSNAGNPHERVFLLLMMDPECQMGMARMKMRAFARSAVK